MLKFLLNLSLHVVINVMLTKRVQMQHFEKKLLKAKLSVLLSHTIMVQLRLYLTLYLDKFNYKGCT